ncbi:MAG: VWA domain-containing protein [Bacteroidetes bacterium]|jgi:hypothetical protein|nr:VWA domain-containing protein [Bacteroidota bacterium]
MNLKRLKSVVIATTIAVTLNNHAIAAEKSAPVDVVFTLDMSGSTNGLIDDVRDKIWDMNNELSRLSNASTIRYAVVGYGRPSFNSKNQYVKVLCPLTTDIDFLAGELYKLKPNIEKGDQFVGAAIRASVETLNWSSEKNAVKEIFLTGNGSTFLGAFSVQVSCELAKSKGISIQPLYCSSSLRARDIGGWSLVGGFYNNTVTDIKINKRLPSYTTVQDKNRLLDLASELSKTYIYYGKNGLTKFKTMISNEKNAMNSGQSTFEALMYHKISDEYQGQQADWDLVDLIKSRNGNLKNINPTTLPDSLKTTNPEQLLTKLMELKEKRNYLISQLRQLLPYNRQNQVNAFYATKEDESKMIFDRVVTTALKAKINGDVLAAN